MINFDEVTTPVRYDSWSTPATGYSLDRIGNYRIHRENYPRGAYHMWGIDRKIYYQVTKPIPITILQVLEGSHWTDLMVDDPPHYRAMQLYAQACTGNVLVVGLGLGLVVHELVKNPKVQRVKVIEKSQEVIGLVSKYVHQSRPAELVLTQGDIWAVLDTELASTHWDFVIIDIWRSETAAEKSKLLPQVLRLWVLIHEQSPTTKTVFHGFVPMSDVKIVDDDIIPLVIDAEGG